MSLKDEIEVYDKAKISPETGEIEVWDKVIFPNVIRKREIKLIFDLVKEIKPERILDFGCGVGVSTCLLSELGNEVIGYDINKKAVDFANFRARKHNYKAQFTAEMPELGQFDLVLAIDVLEHIEDLRSLILKLGKSMKSGARLYHYGTFEDGSPDHFNHSANINEWLEEAGFEIIDTLWARRK